MSLMNMISYSRDENRSPIITIAGSAGRGKTTFGSTFPNPVLIRVEDGSASVPDMPALPLCKTYEEVVEQLALLVKEDHDFKTVVIDSVTKLDEYAEQYAVRIHNAQGNSAVAIGDISWGIGYTMLQSAHKRIRSAANVLREKGIGTVFIAHTKYTEIKQPDGDNYMRLSLDMNKKATDYYLNDVDLVGYLDLDKNIVKSDSNSKAAVDNKVSTVKNRRILYVTESAARDTKNRFGLTKDFTVAKGENPLLEILYPASNNEEVK